MVEISFENMWDLVKKSSDRKQAKWNSSITERGKVRDSQNERLKSGYFQSVDKLKRKKSNEKLNNSIFMFSKIP